MGIYVKTDTGLQPIKNNPTKDEIVNALGYTPANPDDIIIPDVDMSDVESDDDTLYVVDKYGNKIAQIDKDGIHTTDVNATGVYATDVNLGEKDTTDWSLKKHLEDAKLEKASETEHTYHVTPEDRAKWNENTLAVTDLTNDYNAHKINDSRHKTAAEDEAIDADDEGKTFVIVDKNGYKIAEIDAEGLHVLDVKIGTGDGKSVADMIKDAIAEIEIPEVDLSNHYTKDETYSKTEIDNKGFLTEHQDISGKQDTLAFDGTYNASTNKAATVKTVTDKIAEVVADAPEDFNTLKEMSTWIAEHTDSAATMNAAIQENKQAIADMSDEIVSEQTEFHIVDSNGNIVATIDANGVQSIAFLDKDGNELTNLAPLFTRTRTVFGISATAQTDLGYSAVITIETNCNSVANVKLLSTSNFNSQKINVSVEGGTITVSGWADSAGLTVTAQVSYVAAYADYATKAAQDNNGNVIPNTYATMQDLEDGAIPVASAETAKSLKSGWAVSYTTSGTSYGAPTMTMGKAYLIAFIVSGVTHTVAFVYMGNSGYSTPNKDGVFCYYHVSTNTFGLEDGNGYITASGFYVREL